MPIMHSARAANGITVGYHKATKLEVDLNADTAVVSVCSYTDEQAYQEKLPIAWMWSLGVPVALLSMQGTLLEDIETALVEMDGSPFQFGQIVSDSELSLDVVRAKKYQEINRARLAANQSSFIFQEKEIAFDQLSFIDIVSANGEIALTGELPEGWLGGWLAKDGTFVSIPDVATWTLFYKAMVKQGQINFLRSRQLKLAVAAAQTAEDISAIQW
jgi:hypothetical protein